MRFHKVQQISESHCGPAVLEMLLDGIGVTISQEEITEAAGARNSIEELGTRVDQLAKATQRIAPGSRFWYKYFASLDDIKFVLDRGYGVGVEWQGLFYESEEEEQEEEEVDTGERGHYSIVSYYDPELESMVIVDPYKDFAQQDRILPSEMFLRRWWDINKRLEPFTGKMEVTKDTRLLFFITPAFESFPVERGFKVFGE